METIRTTAIINENGRVVIPASIRNAMHIKGGDKLMLVYNDSGLTIETRRQVMERARKKLQIEMNVPEGMSLVDELIKGRREEAKREEDEYK